MRRDWKIILDRAVHYVGDERLSLGVAPTLRRLHYLLVSDAEASQAGYVNTQNCYKQLSEKSARARDARTFPELTDRTRSVSRALGSWTPRQELEFLARSFTISRAHLMEPRVIILVEKDGVVPLVESRFDWLDVAAVRGYPSLSFITTLNRLHDNGNVIALYVGDFDPSGLDISRHLMSKLNFPMYRVGLSALQVQQYNLPPLPAKDGDSRTARMVATEGSAMQVELDALPGSVLLDLLAETITAETGTVIRPDGMPDWPDVDLSEQDTRERLLEFAKGWSE